MDAKAPKRDLLPLLRECKLLDRKRVKGELTPAEHARWIQLHERLSAALRPGHEKRASARVAVKLNVSFETPEAFQEATIQNMSRGGVFVTTSHPAALGTKLELSVVIQSTGIRVELPCVVVSQNVGRDFSVGSAGMGLKFAELGEEQRKAVDEIYTGASAAAAEKLFDAIAATEPDGADATGATDATGPTGATGASDDGPSGD